MKRSSQLRFKKKKIHWIHQNECTIYCFHLLWSRTIFKMQNICFVRSSSNFRIWFGFWFHFSTNFFSNLNLKIKWNVFFAIFSACMYLYDSDTAEILFVNTFNGNMYDKTKLENGTIYIQTPDRCKCWQFFPLIAPHWVLCFLCSGCSFQNQFN